MLTISTCMAPNMDFFCRDLAAYIADRLGQPVHFLIDVQWQERERLLDAGQIDLCWICGLPYVQKADQTPGKIVPLVAPVMAGRRYEDRPVYFSDVVVHRDSSFQTLSNLQGASWAFNEPGSHSGYGVVRYALAAQGKAYDFFGEWVQAGSHQNALQMILNREVAGAAIDSTVLEMEISLHPEIESQIRKIDTFGPSPIPPWVISDQVDGPMRQALRQLLVEMDRDVQGRALLNKAGMKRFMPADDQDYDPIREMTRIGFGG